MNFTVSPALPVILCFRLCGLCNPPAYGGQTKTDEAEEQQPAEIILPEGESSGAQRQTAGAGEKVALPGAGWRQTAGPEIALRREAGGMYFRPVEAGCYVFEASRAGGASARREVTVPPGREAGWGDRRPLAEFLTKNPTGQPRQPVLLDASLSHHPDGLEESKALTAHWSTPDKHRGIVLEPLPGLKARFTARRPGMYSVALVVSDGRLDSEPPETVFINIDESAETGAGSDRPSFPSLEEKDARYRPVKLGLWESNLDYAVRRFPAHCGLALRVDPEFAPPDAFAGIPLHLEVENAPLLHLLDWLARQAHCVYRREGGVSFWLTTPLGWLKQEKLEPLVEPADALYEKKDAGDLLASLAPCFQKLLGARPGLSLEFQAERQVLVGVLTTSAAARLKEICRALRAAADEVLPPLERDWDAERALRQTLAQKMITLTARGRQVDYVLRDLAAAAGLAVGFDPRQFPRGLPRLNVDITGAPLRDAVRTLVDLAGFDGCAVEPPRGLWFYRGPPPYPNGELLWDQVIVHAYELSNFLPRVAPLGGEAIVHLIQQRIYPESWHDPAALCFYHAPTKKLLVMHGAPAHIKIAEFFADLWERGEWALGPVEEAERQNEK